MSKRNERPTFKKVRKTVMELKAKVRELEVEKNDVITGLIILGIGTLLGIGICKAVGKKNRRNQLN